MAVAWPATLPQSPLIEDYGEQLADRTIRTEMDAGPAKVRRRFQVGVGNVTVSMIMDDTQMSTFDNFYKTTLEGGSLRFDFTDPRTNTSREWRILPRPQLNPLANNVWRVEMEWEQLT